MASKPPLRAVTDQDAPPPKRKPRTMREAVDGSEREVLETMRAKLAAELDAGVPPAYLAPISRQLREIDKEIRLLDLRAKEEADQDAVSNDEEWDAETL